MRAITMKFGLLGITVTALVAVTAGPALALVAALALTLISVPLLIRRSFSVGPPADSGPASTTSVEIESVPAEGVSRRRALTVLALTGAGIAVPTFGATDRIFRVKPTGSKAAAAGPGGRTRQWGMIIDLRKCDGCQSQGTAPQCTTACIEGHLAPEPMQWIEVYESELPGGGTQFIPTPCQQCQNPPCVSVCPVTATFSTPEGPVLIDQEQCIGCRMCMAACPYDRRFFNWGDAPIPPEALLADYSPEHQAPATRGTVMKCDFCPEMARAGTLPFCAQACPNDAIYYGDLEEDIATNGRELVSFSAHQTENSAYRLKEDLGTLPRVYYIAGHGEEVGRDPYQVGRVATRWPWADRVKGAVTWKR